MSTVSLPQLQGLNVLTHSRMSTFKTCARKHQLAYELGIRPSRGARPLRMGAAVHVGRELFAKVLRRGIARGEFRAVADVEMSAILLAQPLAMHSVWLRSLAPYDESLPADSDRFYTAYLEFVLKGLRP